MRGLCGSSLEGSGDLSFFLSVFFFFFFFEREDGGIRGFLESGQPGTEGLGEKAGRVR